MSLFDEVKNILSGAIGGGHAGLADSIMGIIANKESGGLAGLVDTFKEKGLGDVVSSWIGTGNNLPISPDQVQQVIGEDRIRQLAGKIGASPEEAKSKLAELLPNIIDKLTPEGKLPEAKEEIHAGHV